MFFWEYFGPLVVYPLFYFFPRLLYPGERCARAVQRVRCAALAAASCPPSTPPNAAFVSTVLSSPAATPATQQRARAAPPSADARTVLLELPLHQAHRGDLPCAQVSGLLHTSNKEQVLPPSLPPSSSSTRPPARQQEPRLLTRPPPHPRTPGLATPRCRWPTCSATLHTTGALPRLCPTSSTTPSTPPHAWSRRWWRWGWPCCASWPT